eukprot:Clim_evm19s198 gene=Clim_evmTU19s198
MPLAGTAGATNIDAVMQVILAPDDAMSVRDRCNWLRSVDHSVASGDAAHLRLLWLVICYRVFGFGVGTLDPTGQLGLASVILQYGRGGSQGSATSHSGSTGHPGPANTADGSSPIADQSVLDQSLLEGPERAWCELNCSKGGGAVLRQLLHPHGPILRLCATVCERLGASFHWPLRRMPAATARALQRRQPGGVNPSLRRRTAGGGGGSTAAAAGSGAGGNAGPATPAPFTSPRGPTSHTDAHGASGGGVGIDVRTATGTDVATAWIHVDAWELFSLCLSLYGVDSTSDLGAANPKRTGGRGHADHSAAVGSPTASPSSQTGSGVGQRTSFDRRYGGPVGGTRIPPSAQGNRAAIHKDLEAAFGNEKLPVRSLHDAMVSDMLANLLPFTVAAEVDRAERGGMATSSSSGPQSQTSAAQNGRSPTDSRGSTVAAAAYVANALKPAPSYQHIGGSYTSPPRRPGEGGTVDLRQRPRGVTSASSPSQPAQSPRGAQMAKSSSAQPAGSGGAVVQRFGQALSSYTARAQSFASNLTQGHKQGQRGAVSPSSGGGGPAAAPSAIAGGSGSAQYPQLTSEQSQALIADFEARVVKATGSSPALVLASFATDYWLRWANSEAFEVPPEDLAARGTVPSAGTPRSPRGTGGGGSPRGNLFHTGSGTNLSFASSPLGGNVSGIESAGPRGSSPSQVSAVLPSLSLSAAATYHRKTSLHQLLLAREIVGALMRHLGPRVWAFIGQGLARVSGQWQMQASQPLLPDAVLHSRKGSAPLGVFAALLIGTASTSTHAVAATRDAEAAVASLALFLSRSVLRFGLQSFALGDPRQSRYLHFTAAVWLNFCLPWRLGGSSLPRFGYGGLQASHRNNGSSTSLFGTSGQDPMGLPPQDALALIAADVRRAFGLHSASSVEGSSRGQGGSYRNGHRQQETLVHAIPPQWRTFGLLNTPTVTVLLLHFLRYSSQLSFHDKDDLHLISTAVGSLRVDGWLRYGTGQETEALRFWYAATQTSTTASNAPAVFVSPPTSARRHPSSTLSPPTLGIAHSHSGPLSPTQILYEPFAVHSAAAAPLRRRESLYGTSAGSSSGALRRELSSTTVLAPDSPVLVGTNGTFDTATALPFWEALTSGLPPVAQICGTVVAGHVRPAVLGLSDGNVDGVGGAPLSSPMSVASPQSAASSAAASGLAVVAAPRWSALGVGAFESHLRAVSEALAAALEEAHALEVREAQQRRSTGFGRGFGAFDPSAISALISSWWDAMLDWLEMPGMAGPVLGFSAAQERKRCLGVLMAVEKDVNAGLSAVTDVFGAGHGGGLGLNSGTSGQSPSTTQTAATLSPVAGGISQTEPQFALRSERRPASAETSLLASLWLTVRALLGLDTVDAGGDPDTRVPQQLPLTPAKQRLLVSTTVVTPEGLSQWEHGRRVFRSRQGISPLVEKNYHSLARKRNGRTIETARGQTETETETRTAAAYDEATALSVREAEPFIGSGENPALVRALAGILVPPVLADDDEHVNEGEAERKERQALISERLLLLHTLRLALNYRHTVLGLIFGLVLWLFFGDFGRFVLIAWISIVVIMHVGLPMTWNAIVQAAAR